MSVHPILLCGGSGDRLWPTSRPDLPKAFLPLMGARSGFQTTLVRVARMAGWDEPVVMAAASQARVVAEQLAEIGRAARVVLEPKPRDTAPAIAAAAALIARTDPGGVLVILPCDHHVENVDAFAAAASLAVEAACQGHVVTMGVRPDGPSTQLGYIRPGDPIGGGPLRKVAAFREKPDLATAEQYVAEGCLWNSGAFIARAGDLLEELESYAPKVRSAASLAVAEGNWAGDVLTLSEAFRGAPRISIDFAVMEKTRRAAVLPVAFGWCDLGTWSAVLAASEKDGQGNAVDGDAVLEASSGCLVRAGPGSTVVAVGTRNLAIVVEGDRVLVCDLAQVDKIKAIVGGLGKAATAEG